MDIIMPTHQTAPTQLLCTFSSMPELATTLDQILHAYSVAFNTIYILENVDEPDGLCCTYNILRDAPIIHSIPPATISLHRKKISNTLYTINALNSLITQLNNGKLDTQFTVPWENYSNTILVSTNNKLKVIHTKLHKIIKISEQ
jgi:hypothetical protein